MNVNREIVKLEAKNVNCKGRSPVSAGREETVKITKLKLRAPIVAVEFDVDERREKLKRERGKKCVTLLAPQMVLHIRGKFDRSGDGWRGETRLVQRWVGEDETGSAFHAQEVDEAVAEALDREEALHGSTSRQQMQME
jgi:hypothetical protein